MSERPSDHEPGTPGPADDGAGAFVVRAVGDGAPATQPATRVRPLARFEPEGTRFDIEAPEGPEGPDQDDEPAGVLDAEVDRPDDLHGDASGDPDSDDEPGGDVDPEAGGEPGARPRPARSERGELYQRARSSGGMGGAVLMGAMLGIKDVLQAPREQPAVMMETSGEPHDIDEDGLEMELDDDRRAVTPPLPVMNHLSKPKRGRFRRRR